MKLKICTIVSYFKEFFFINVFCFFFFEIKKRSLEAITKLIFNSIYTVYQLMIKLIIAVFETISDIISKLRIFHVLFIVNPLSVQKLRYSIEVGAMSYQKDFNLCLKPKKFHVCSKKGFLLCICIISGPEYSLML